jgi:hypothetical protein
VGVSALSGWIERQKYADANTLFDLGRLLFFFPFLSSSFFLCFFFFLYLFISFFLEDVNMDFMDISLKSIFESTIVERHVSLTASNLKGIDVLIRRFATNRIEKKQTKFYSFLYCYFFAVAQPIALFQLIFLDDFREC